MQVTLNHQTHHLPEGARVSDAVALLAPPAPFAVAVNGQFVPRPQHASHVLANGDQIDIIVPVTGG